MRFIHCVLRNEQGGSTHFLTCAGIRVEFDENSDLSGRLAPPIAQFLNSQLDQL
jgi:hypothetical protein